MGERLGERSESTIASSGNRIDHSIHSTAEGLLCAVGHVVELMSVEVLTWRDLLLRLDRQRAGFVAESAGFHAVDAVRLTAPTISQGYDICRCGAHRVNAG